MIEKNKEVRELPKGWIWTSIRKIAESMQNGIYKPAHFYRDTGIACLRMYNIENGKIVWKNIKRITLLEKEVKQYHLDPGDILINRVNSRELVGKAALIPKNIEACVYESKNVRLRLFKKLTKSSLVAHWFLLHGRNYFEQNAQQTVGMASVNQEQIGSMSFPLAPINEQTRIVDKIEELFSDLDNGIENLKTSQKQLKVYRQAVLRWAFEGKLTEEWRKRNSDLPTAKDLLTQIKAERENRYQQQLAEWEQAVKAWEANGKPGKKPTKPQKNKDIPLLTQFELSELPKIPSAWCWVKLEEITDDIFDGPFGSNLKTQDYTDAGVRVVRLENIEYLHFNNDKKTFISEEKYKTIERHTVHKGDIIFSSFMNEEIRATVLPNLEETAIAKADCFCIRSKGNLITQKWLVFMISSRSSYNRLITETHGFTRPRINTTQLKNLVVPLCPLEEQNQIVQEIESRLSICDRLEETITTNLKKAEALRQSILKQAFAGKLVPQDPKDEPAEKLLERIRVERQQTQQTQLAK